MAANLENRHLENVCRLCLTDASEAGDMLPIFPVRGGNPNNPSSMVNRIQQCTSLKLEHKDGVPSSICELCSVRLEDWYAFREQCLGSDEYLRVALARNFYTVIQKGQTAASFSSTIAQRSVEHFSKAEIAMRHASVVPPQSSDGSSESKSTSLAKRRKSTFEWTVAGGDCNVGGQKLEVLDEPTDGQTASKQPEHNGDTTPAYEQRHSTAGIPHGTVGMVPSDINTLLEQASWSKEYSARVNSLMLLVNGTRPYKCKICRKLFKARSNLRRHIKVSHSDEIVEGESPPPECYDFGHIHRAGGAGKQAGLELFASPENQHQRQGEFQAGSVKRKRRSTDPPIIGPHRCHLCPRSFKMPAHLAVHMKAHQKVEAGQPALSVIEQQIQQESRQPRTESSQLSVFSERSRNTDIEPSDIIQLSDDDEEEEVQQVKQGTETGNNQSDELDDGFDEEEGSLKEGVPIEPGIELRTGASPLSMTVRMDSRGAPERDDENAMVKQEEVRSALVTAVSNAVGTVKLKTVRLSAPGTIPPGPLSMKQRYRESLENGTIPARSFIIARPKQQASRQQSPVTPTPRTPPAVVVVETPGAVAPTSISPQQGSLAALHRCHFCQQTFPHEELLRAHQKTHQADGPFPFRCRWCQKGFRYRQNYTTHVEKQTCRLLNGEGLVQSAGGKQPLPMARPITANKRPW